MKIQKSKLKLPSLRKILIIAAVLVATLLVVAQGVLDVYMYRNAQRLNDYSNITNLVINSIDKLRVPAPIDPKTGDVYFTEAHLVLPPRPDSTPQLLYNDTSSREDGTNIQVTTPTILGRAESRLWSAQASMSGWGDDWTAVFDQVPNLQACARGVQIFSKPQTQDRTFKLKATKQLTDGRTLYMYTESTCEYNLMPLIDYVKQVQSY